MRIVPALIALLTLGCYWSDRTPDDADPEFDAPEPMTDIGREDAPDVGQTEDSAIIDSNDSGTSTTRSILGPGRLFAFHSDEGGVTLVEVNEVYRLDHEGRELARWRAGLPIIAAWFEGDQLTVADATHNTVLDRDLVVRARLPRPSPCEMLVTHDGRALCTVEKDIHRLFSLSTGELLWEGRLAIYPLGGFFPVAGRGRVIATDIGTGRWSPSLVDLEGDPPSDMGTRSFRRSDPITQVSYAFVGAERDVMVDGAGRLLEIGDCARLSYLEAIGGEACFTERGRYAGLADGDVFVGLGTTDEGIAAVARPISLVAVENPACSGDCRVLLFDGEARVVSDVALPVELDQVMAVQYVAPAGLVYVAGHRSTCWAGTVECADLAVHAVRVD